MWWADSLEKTLMLGKTEGRRRGRQDEMGGWHHRRSGPVAHLCLTLLWPCELQHARLPCPSLPSWVCSKFEAWHAAVLGVTKNQTWLSGQTTRLELFFPCSSVWDLIPYSIRSYTVAYCGNIDAAVTCPPPSTPGNLWAWMGKKSIFMYNEF